MARSRGRSERDDDEGDDIAGRAGRGFFGRAKAMIGGIFSGAFSGTLFWGSIIFFAQALGLAGPIAKAIGGDELAAKVAGWGRTADGVDNIGQRILISGALGAAMGASGGAAKGLLTPDGNGPMSGIIGIGMALVTAAVVVGTAVNHGDNSTPGGRPASRPAPGGRPAAQPAPH